MKLMIEKYIKYLRYERNYSSHTEISYFEDLCQFSDFLIEHFSDVDVQSVDSDIVRLWIVSLMENKMSARTVNRKLSALKSFYKYLLRIGYVSHNPVKKVVGPKISKPIPTFVRDANMNEILDASIGATGDAFVEIRNHTMIELFYVTGIRRAELLGLKNVDVDFWKNTIRVIGKRNKERIIPISSETRLVLERYAEVRDRDVENQSGFFFVKEDGQPMYPMLVHRIVSENLKQIPTLSKTSPHVLRHTFATGMLNNGADINAVKELLGHSSLAATEIYTHTSFEELKKIYNKAHPRA